MKRDIFTIGLILFCLALAAGCGGGGGGGGSAGTGDPLTIATLSATAGSETVTLSWTESGDTGRVEITWRPDGTTVQTVQPGTGAFTATDLIPGTAYTFTVTSIDGDENITDELTATATPFLEGAPEDAVYVGTVAGLRAIDDDLAGYYVLSKDIDLSGEAWTPLCAEWEDEFSGTLDGNGHAITGLTIDSTDDFQGLFGFIGSEGTVANLRLEDVSLSAGYASGPLAGENYGTIRNCASSGTVTGTNQYIGGLVGSNHYGTISDSSSACNVESDSFYVGGLAGSMEGGSISNSRATGTVSGAENVGGLVGLVAATSTATISGCHATGDVTGDGYLGGLVGTVGVSDTRNDTTISDCYATGDVSGTVSSGGSFSRVGGLVGDNNNCDISNCYATGDVSGTAYNIGGLVGNNYTSSISDSHATGDVSGDVFVGGLIGRNEDIYVAENYGAGSFPLITDCYATGSVSATGNYVGGLIGGNFDCDVTYCHTDISGNVESEGRFVGGLVGGNDNLSDYSVFDGISYSYALIGGRVAGVWNIGGLVGLNDDMPLSFCYAHAAGGVISNATDSSEQQTIGGLVGRNDDATINGTISYCYALSDVTGYRYIGGLVGQNGSGTSAVTACYATGAVTGSTGVGGLLGYSGSVTGSDSYFNSANTENGYGNAVSLANMKLQDTFAGWDFVDETANGEEEIWSIGTLNSGYPYLTDLVPAE